MIPAKDNEAIVEHEPELGELKFGFELLVGGRCLHIICSQIFINCKIINIRRTPVN